MNTSCVLGTVPGIADAEMSQPVRNQLVGRLARQTEAGWCQLLGDGGEGSCLVGSDGSMWGLLQNSPQGQQWVPPMVLSRLRQIPWTGSWS